MIVRAISGLNEVVGRIVSVFAVGFAAIIRPGSVTQIVIAMLVALAFMLLTYYLDLVLLLRLHFMCWLF